MKTLITYMVVLTICISTVFVIIHIIDNGVSNPLTPKGVVVISPTGQNSGISPSRSTSFTVKDVLPDQAAKIQRITSRTAPSEASVVKGRKFPVSASVK